MADYTSNTSWAPRILSVLRIIAAFLLMQHGGQKLLGYPPSPPPPCPPPQAAQQQPAAPPSMPPLILVAGVLELFGGLLLLLGLFTRPTAFVLSGFMAAAYFIGHASRGWAGGKGFWPVYNGGELAVIYCFVFLYLAFAGGGPWSLDALIRRRA